MSQPYALVLSHGKLVVSLPEKLTPEEVEKVLSFLNWTFRIAQNRVDSPPSPRSRSWRGLFTKRPPVSGAYYHERT